MFPLEGRDLIFGFRNLASLIIIFSTLVRLISICTVNKTKALRKKGKSWQISNIVNNQRQS